MKLKPTITLILLSVLISPAFSVEISSNTVNQTSSGVTSDVFNGGTKEVTKKPVSELKRVSENGGEVLIDGSLRVYETEYSKVFDLVETSTPVTPSTNHVKLFAVQMGTWTAIKALFDDGVIRSITNN